MIMGKKKPKAPKRCPSRKEIEKILEADNEHELFLVGHVCIERILDKILEKKFGIPFKLDEPVFMWRQKYLILKESGTLVDEVRGNVERIDEIRSRYAHRLNPNEQYIRSLINKLVIIDAPAGAESRARAGTKFERYRVCVISTFSALEKVLRS